MPRARRLDAPDRRRARLHGHLGDRRRRHPAGDRPRLGGADPQAGRGRPVLLRRRRVQAGRVRRVAEHRVAVEAPDRLRDGEQRLQRRHPVPPGGRQRGRRRAAGDQGQGVQHARRDGRRRSTRSPSTRSSAPRSRAPARETARRWSSPRSTACRAHGNLIAPPGVPLHYPEHEAIEVFGDPEQYEAALRGDPVPRFRGVAGHRRAR